MPASSTVVLVPCPDYDPGRVTAAVDHALPLLGGDALARTSASSGKAVLLKPNMLRTATAEKGITTHPSVFGAVARYLARNGARLTFGDSPNGIFRAAAVARQSGLLAEAEALGVPMADFETGSDVTYPEGRQNRRFHVARGVLEAGALVNLPKLKTHSLTRMTGALKNIFGVIPGARKAEFHIRHPDVEGFSRMIADLNGLVRSDLVVMDAVRAMEGNGPTGGDLVPLGVLLFSRDPVAVDAVACRIIGIDPMTIPMIRYADEAGIGHAADIDVVGAEVSRFVPRSFVLPARSLAGSVPRPFVRLARALAVPKPRVDERLCTRCGECIDACPAAPKALSRSGPDVPEYDFGLCIRCYCCQETCRQGAISLKPAPLSRFFGGPA